MAIVTLLTDFGLADSYVGEMKGALLSRAPDVQLVDLTHEVPPGDVRAAQYLLSRAWRRFPEGTVHLVVVDPGVGSDRRALAVGAFGHSFVGPDNGVFTEVLIGAGVVALPVSEAAAPTFHGRDVFAPAAAELALGTDLRSLGPAITDPVRLEIVRPTRDGARWFGSVIYVDRFGSLITNVPEKLISPETRIRVGDFDVGRVRRTFADVASGATVAVIGSNGTVEIAVRDGSAARRLGLGVGAKVRI